LIRWVLAFIALATLAPGVTCLELSGGVRGGAGGSLFYGGWVDNVRGELEGLGAATVSNRVYVSWRGGGWVEVPVPELCSFRVEADIGPVGGSLLASDGYDMLVGITGLELALQVLAVQRIRIPVGEVVLGSGIFIGGAFPVREIRNDGTVRSEGELADALASIGLACGAGCAFPIGPGAITVDLRVLATLFSIADPRLAASIKTVSIEVMAGWEFRPRGAR
jgi:hypothetical protein